MKLSFLLLLFIASSVKAQSYTLLKEDGYVVRRYEKGDTVKFFTDATIVISCIKNKVVADTVFKGQHIFVTVILNKQLVTMDYKKPLFQSATLKPL